MPMKYFLPFILFFCNPAFSQEPIHNNPKTIIAEFGKNGLVFNLLYDHYFAQKHFGFHAGGGTTLFNRRYELRTATIGFYFLIGKKREFYDLGLDLQYHYSDIYADDVRGFIFIDPPITYEGFYPFVIIGYRRYSDKGLFRIGFAPGIIEKEFITGAYVGYGVILNRKQPK